VLRFAVVARGGEAAIQFEGKRMILMNTREVEFLGQKCIAGTEVNRYGDEVAPRGVDERRRIIQLSLITERTPLVMSKKYARLETAEPRRLA